MVKRIVTFIIAVIILFIAAFYLNKMMLAERYELLRFSLFNVYLFHLIGAVIVYAAVEGVASIMPNNAGYTYLATIFLKIGFFVLIFPAVLSGEVKLEMFEKLSLVIPMFLFLGLEGFFVGKLLNSK